MGVWTAGRVQQIIDEARSDFDPVPIAMQIAQAIDVWTLGSTPLLAVAGNVTGYLYRLGREPGDAGDDAEVVLAIGALVDLLRGGGCYDPIDNIVTDNILGVPTLGRAQCRDTAHLPGWEDALRRAIRWQEVARAVEWVLAPELRDRPALSIVEETDDPHR